MKKHLLTLALFGFLIQVPIFAQNVTSVNATSNEISDNLDLRAVASIFGDSKNLEDFERRLNDPRNQISNLDLNYDRQVDYLRVVEVVEKRTHLIILQAVLEKDVFQDVATIEVERGRNNQVQVQVVGNSFFYGPHYIYEPVYVHTPVIYNMFWVNNYSPYYSPYYYNYYPNYYYAWTPYPVYRYRRNVHVHINQYNYYNYSNHRNSSHAVAMYETRRNNSYETRNPGQSFSTRNTAINRYELDQATASGGRNQSVGTRNYTSTNPVRNNESTTGVRNTSGVRNADVQENRSVNATVRTTNPTSNVRSTVNQETPTRNYTQNQVRSAEINSDATLTSSVRSTTVSPNVRGTVNQATPTRSYTQQQPVRSTPQAPNVTRSQNNVNRSNSQVNSVPRTSNTRSGGSSAGNRTYSRN